MSEPMTELAPELDFTPLITSARRAIILDHDRPGSEQLRRTLGALGYSVEIMTDEGAAVLALRVSMEPLVALFDVEAYGRTLDGASYTSLIGALLNDPALTRRHTFGAISSTADEVEAALGKLLTRLGVTILRKPCDAITLAAFLARPGEPS